MGRLLKKKATATRKKGKAADPDKNGTPAGSPGPKRAVAVPSAGGPGSRVSAPAKKKATAWLRPASSPQNRNFFEKAVQFLREVKVELKKVAWPSRKQTMGSTLVVIVLVMIIAVFLGVADISLSSLIRVVLQ